MTMCNNLQRRQACRGYARKAAILDCLSHIDSLLRFTLNNAVSESPSLLSLYLVDVNFVIVVL